jgi:hypothetical protein
VSETGRKREARDRDLGASAVCVAEETKLVGRLPAHRAQASAHCVCNEYYRDFTFARALCDWAGFRREILAAA